MSQVQGHPIPALSSSSLGFAGRRKARGEPHGKVAPALLAPAQRFGMVRVRSPSMPREGAEEQQQHQVWGEKGQGQGKGTAATLCWAPWNTAAALARVHSQASKRSTLRGLEQEAEVWLPALQDREGSREILPSCSEPEESPFIRHKLLQFPWEAPTHGPGRGQGLQQSKALQGVFLQGKNSIQSR